ncbi:unnamed protein product, partial [Prorocentrum cordatum]
MDLQDQREIADALLSTKGDVVKRQQAALRRLQTLISGGVYPGQLLTLVAQVVCSSQVPDLRREAAQALGGALGSPQVRERCSAFGELLSTLWGAIGEAALCLKSERRLAPSVPGRGHGAHVGRPRRTRPPRDGAPGAHGAAARVAGAGRAGGAGLAVRRR